MLSDMAPASDIAAGESLDQLQAELAQLDLTPAGYLPRPASADKRCDGCASCSCGRAAADPGA
jgi:hypothetical protein